MKLKVEFLNRLFQLRHCKHELLDFLIQSKFITEEEVKDILIAAPLTHAQLIYNILYELEKDDKIQLVSYEWTVLPKEKGKFSLVTDYDTKDFEFQK